MCRTLLIFTFILTISHYARSQPFSFFLYFFSLCLHLSASRCIYVCLHASIGYLVSFTIVNYLSPPPPPPLSLSLSLSLSLLLHPSFYLSIYLSNAILLSLFILIFLYLSIYLSISLYTSISFYPYLPLSFYLSHTLYTSISIYLSPALSYIRLLFY